MQSQMYIPPLSKVNKTILIIYIATFFLSSIAWGVAKFDFVSVFGLSTVGLRQGFIFQLITFPFVDKGLMGVVFNALILWFIGSELEEKWGRKFYLKFLAVSTYSCGLIFVLFGVMAGNFVNFLPLYGIAGTNLALLVAYGIIFSERTMIFMFIFPMKAKYFCLLLAAIEIFMALSSSAFNSAWGHVVAMGTGFLFLKYESLKMKGLGLKDIFENNKAHRARKKRGNLRLVKEKQPDPKHDPEDPKFWQ